MSKSKRAAQGPGVPAPREEKRLFVDSEGRLGTGWLLAVSLLCCMAATLAARFGLVRAFAALFEAWGLNASNTALAPLWARTLYIWHGSLATLVYAVLLLGLSYWLRRLWLGGDAAHSFDGKRLARGALAGLAAALLIGAVCLLPDSARLEWSLSAPRLSWVQPLLLAVSLLGTLAEEEFSKRVLYDGLRARWKRPWAIAVVCAVFFLMNGGYSAGLPGMLNALLLGFASCLLYERGGLWLAVGFRWSWSAANLLLLGFGGGEYAVYRLYGVSETMLTGGDAGPTAGLWTTLLLVGGIAWLLPNTQKQTG